MSSVDVGLAARIAARLGVCKAITQVVHTHGRGEDTGHMKADGGAWKNMAIQNIAKWLKAELPEIVVIA